MNKNKGLTNDTTLDNSSQSDETGLEPVEGSVPSFLITPKMLKASSKSRKEAPAGSDEIKLKKSQDLAREGQKLSKSGLFEEAIEKYNKSLEINGSQPDVLILKALALLKLNKYEDAIEDAIKVANMSRELKPDYAYAKIIIGRALSKLGRHGEYISAFKSAADDYNRTLIEGNNENDFVNRGEALWELGLYDEANKSYNEALKLNDLNTGAYIGISAILLEQHLPERSIYYSEKAIQINSHISEAWSNKGWALQKLGRYMEALHSYDMALELNPRLLEAMVNKGITLVDLGREDEAFSIYEKILAINPRYVHAWINKGVALSKQGKLEEALAAYETAIEIDDTFPSAWYGRGNVLYDLGRYDDSVKSYEETLQLDPVNANVWNNLGLVLYHKGNYEKALHSYENATRINPELADAWYGMGIVLQELGSNDKAVIALANARDVGIGDIEKSGIFFLFFSVYILTALVGYKRFKGRKASTIIIILLANLMGFWAFGWMLSCIFDLQLVWMFLISGTILAISIPVLWSLLGGIGAPLRQEVTLAFREFESHLALPLRITRIICLASMIGYILIATIFFFRLGISSDQRVLDFLRAALILMLVVSWFVTLPTLAGMLLSANTRADARNAIIISQFGYLGMNALFVSLILWVLGIGSGGTKIVISSVHVPLSIHLLAVMMSVFLLTTLIPYFSGWQKAQVQHVAMMMKQRSWLAELLDILEFPTPHLYVPKLKKLLNEMGADDCVLENRKIVPNAAAKSQLYDRAKADPRLPETGLSYLKFLHRIQDRMRECIDQMELMREDDKIINLACAYANVFRLRDDELSKAMDAERSNRPKLWVILAFILTPIIVQILNSLSSWVATKVMEGYLMKIPSVFLPAGSI